MIKAIVEWWTKPSQTPEEKYLSQATDLVDLENRMKQLRYKGYWI